MTPPPMTTTRAREGSGREAMTTIIPAGREDGCYHIFRARTRPVGRAWPRPRACSPRLAVARRDAIHPDCRPDPEQRQRDLEPARPHEERDRRREADRHYCDRQDLGPVLDAAMLVPFPHHGTERAIGEQPAMQACEPRAKHTAARRRRRRERLLGADGSHAWVSVWCRRSAGSISTRPTTC